MAHEERARSGHPLPPPQPVAVKPKPEAKATVVTGAVCGGGISRRDTSMGQRGQYACWITGILSLPAGPFGDPDPWTLTPPSPSPW